MITVTITIAEHDAKSGPTGHQGIELKAFSKFENATEREHATSQAIIASARLAMQTIADRAGARMHDLQRREN